MIPKVPTGPKPPFPLARSLATYGTRVPFRAWLDTPNPPLSRPRRPRAETADAPLPARDEPIPRGALVAPPVSEKRAPRPNEDLARVASELVTVFRVGSVGRDARVVRLRVATAKGAVDVSLTLEDGALSARLSADRGELGAAEALAAALERGLAARDIATATIVVEPP